MDTTHTFAGVVLRRRATVCLVTITILTIIALVSACSDSSELADTTPEDKYSHSSDTRQISTVRDETATTIVPDIQEERDSKIQDSSQDSVRNEVNTTALSSEDEKSISKREEVDAGPPPSPDTLLPAETGPLSLDERILRADVIARATLTSVSTTTPFLSDRNLETTTAQYVSTLELRFDAHEYLKGSGADTLLVELPLSFQDYYASIEDAVAAASAWLPERDTRWDDREAIIFLQNPIGTLAGSEGTGSNRYVFSTYTLGYGVAHDDGTAYAVDEYYVDTYSIRSEKSKLWLPAISVHASGASGASGAVEASYYLEEPPASSTGASGQSAGVSSITLSNLKSRVQAMNTLVEQGEGVSGYRECLEEKYDEERALQTLGMEGIWREESMGLSATLYSAHTNFWSICSSTLSLLLTKSI